MVLLPYKFKRIGAIIAPLGFMGWVLMQLGVITRALSGTLSSSTINIINIIVAVISFFLFLTGVYFLVFSKEKVEDEMANSLRLSSFQFASLVQMVYIIGGFIFMSLVYEPGDGGLTMFFITAIVIYYLVFVTRFNYLLHSKYKNEG